MSFRSRRRGQGRNEMERVRPLRALGRAALRRCPRCGLGGLFSRWWTMAEDCPRCGLDFERSEGFWLGAMAINLGVTEVVFGAFVAVGLILTWPDVPWVALTVAAVLLNAAVPVVFYPFSKTIFLAIDLLLHQVDNRDPHELGGRVILPTSSERPRS